MFASGLTIARNAIRMGYPLVPAIRSVLPLVDEFLVVLGESDDGTREAVEDIDDPRIRILDTVWSERVQPRRALLAQQTNLGLHQCRGVWTVYVQANEVLHEDDHDRLSDLMRRHAEDERIEALLLERRSYYADFDHYLHPYPFRFKYSPRIVKPHGGLHSIRDGMSFAVFDGYSTRGRYPRAVDTGCDLHRYGFVLGREALAAKLDQAVHASAAYGRDACAEGFFGGFVPSCFVAPVRGSHPAVMNALRRGFPPQYREAVAACGRRPTLREVGRLLESAFYRRFGFPRRRTNRYRLIGDYVPKPRRTLGELGVSVGGTLSPGQPA